MSSVVKCNASVMQMSQIVQQFSSQHPNAFPLPLVFSPLFGSTS